MSAKFSLLGRGLGEPPAESLRLIGIDGLLSIGCHFLSQSREVWYANINPLGIDLAL